ncbi:unnamed protein product [Discula destructiva]
MVRGIEESIPALRDKVQQHCNNLIIATSFLYILFRRSRFEYNGLVYKTLRKFEAQITGGSIMGKIEWIAQWEKSNPLSAGANALVSLQYDFCYRKLLRLYRAMCKGTR